VNEQLENLLGKLDGVRKTSPKQYIAICPAHDDDKPSLSIGGGATFVLLHCQAGCATKDVLAAVGLVEADLYPPREKRSAARPKRASENERKIVATYDYCDVDGTLLYQAVRYDPKDFRQRRPDGKGGWIGSVKGVKVVPYRLPELLAADAAQLVFIVEGEKDVNNCYDRSLIATCNAMGAAKRTKGKRKPACKWKPDHAQCLDRRQVVILPDNDEAGADHAQGVAATLVGIAASIKILDLPGLPPKGDVSDWFAAGGTAEQLLELAAAAPEYAPPDEPPALPMVELPGGIRTITATGAEFGKLLAEPKTHFCRGGAVFRIDSSEKGEPILKGVEDAELASDLESVAQPAKRSRDDDELEPTICSTANARLILKAQAFREALPPLTILSRCPLLIERDGELVEVSSYDPISGILVYGEPAATVDVAAAKHLLADLLVDFQFATAADRSRALAALITPAMIFGGLLAGRAPMDLGEADQSQTGKGFRHKLIGAIYGQIVASIHQKHTSSKGSLEDSFNRELINGKLLIQLDNVRGRIDSQAIESFLTEDSYIARCAYAPDTAIDPRRICVMLTSNKADMTIDLANRSSCVRILKQPDGYQFREYPEGDVLAHVRANQPRYLGAVFAVIRAWHAAGKPRTRETRHDFRAWCQTLDWIVQNVLEAPPIMDGHRETQARMTNPALNWLRDVALAAVRQHRKGVWLIANDVLNVLEADGTLEIPGFKDGCNLEDEATMRAPTHAGAHAHEAT
jgi:hypothetical protein